MSSTLYDEFNAFNPRDLLNIGEDHERKAGHRLYEKQKVSGLTWLKPARHLRLSCDKRQVEFASKRNRLVGACSCGAHLDDKVCRHLFASLFTICNLLDDSFYRVLFRNNKFHEFLKHAYWSASEPASRRAEGDGNHPELQLYLDGSGYFRVRLPSAAYSAFEKRKHPDSDPLYRLTRLRSKSSLVQQALLAYLDKQTGFVPVCVDTPRRTYPGFHWDPDFTAHAENTLTIDQEENVTCSHKIYTADESKQLISCIPLPPRLVVDPAEARIGALKGYRDLDSLIGDHLFVDYSSPNRFVLTSQGREEARRHLRFENADGSAGSLVLSSRVRVDLTLDPDQEVYAFTPRLVTDRVEDGATSFLTPWLNTLTRISDRVRRHIAWQMVDAFFLEEDLESAHSAQQEIIHAARVSSDERDRLLRHVKTIERDLLTPRFVVVGVHNKCWREMDVPVRDIGYALAIARRLLNAKMPELAAEPHLIARGTKTKNKLHLLLTTLQGRNIELHIDGQPVHEARLSIQLAAGKGRGIDWFELHPNIRIEGRTLTEVEWLRILTGQGVVDTKRGLAIVASEDMEILQRLRDDLRLRGQSDEAADGEPIRMRRLQMIEWLELERKNVQIILKPKDRRLLDSLRAFNQAPTIPGPKRLRTNLRDYQKRGYDWLVFLYAHRLGACLADDMGLGKTIQTIAFLGGLKEKLVPPHDARTQRHPHLIIAPSSVVFNWCEEIRRFYPELRVHEYHGANRRTAFKNCDVAVTSYAILARDIEKLERKYFHVVVFDEAQALKNIRTQRTSAARKLKSAFTICLTGTPMENHIGEFYAILDLALPGLLGPYRRFMAQGEDERVQIVTRRTRPFVLRRTKSMILKELPPKIENEVRLELSDFQRECYTRTVREIRSEVGQAYERKTGAQASIIALTALLRLRQICISPALINQGTDVPSPKIDFLRETLAELRDEGHSALVFSQFTGCLDLIECALAERGLTWLRLDGRTPTSKRQHLVETFQSADGPPIFLVSLKSGGVGLNLTRAGYVFHVDPWWNPAVENQATDRAHRIGQSQTVIATRLIMRHTIEEKMERLKKRKARAFQAVLSESIHHGPGTVLTRDDFEYLLES